MVHFYLNEIEKENYNNNNNNLNLKALSLWELIILSIESFATKLSLNCRYL